MHMARIRKQKQAGNRLSYTDTTTPILHLPTGTIILQQHPTPTNLRSQVLPTTAASQASTTSTRGPCKGILIGSDFALAFEFFPVPSPLVEEDEEDKRFRFSNAFCSARPRCLSATGARMIRAQSSTSVRSTFPCDVGAGRGEEEGVAASASTRADVDVDADPTPTPTRILKQTETSMARADQIKKIRGK
jgi:hypothetical protein